MTTAISGSPKADHSILVTGGTGYIGSHACVELIQAGFGVVVIDNLCNSKAGVIDRIEKITGRRPRFVNGDIRDHGVMDDIFCRYHISAAMHFAGLKSVGESVEKPLEYYDCNVYGSLVLFETMAKHGVFNVVFSSSATVYGDPSDLPIREDSPLAATNPYGSTKIMVENILQDLVVSDPRWRVASLRYFNPIGAHESGMIGEDPNGIPSNLAPYVCQVAAGKRDFLSVFGNDYPTADGTGVRDYIHVVDLAKGHLAALDHLLSGGESITVNLGTGRGTSVLELVDAFEKASGKKIPKRIVSRRPGDIAASYTDPQRAKKQLGWQAERSVVQMCADMWKWQQWSHEHQDLL